MRFVDEGHPLLILTILLMAEILHQLIGSLTHYLQGFIHPRRCRISAINSMIECLGYCIFTYIRLIFEGKCTWNPNDLTFLSRSTPPQTRPKFQSKQKAPFP